MRAGCWDNNYCRQCSDKAESERGMQRVLLEGTASAVERPGSRPAAYQRPTRLRHRHPPRARSRCACTESHTLFDSARTAERLSAPSSQRQHVDARASCSNRSASMLCPAWRQRKASRLAIKEFSPAQDNCTAPTSLSISPSVLAYMGRPLSRPLWTLLENGPVLSCVVFSCDFDASDAQSRSFLTCAR